MRLVVLRTLNAKHWQRLPLRIKNGCAEAAMAAQFPWLRYQREFPAHDLGNSATQ